MSTPNMHRIPASCYRCQGLTGGCNGQCAPRPYEPHLGLAEVPAKGCICPPTSEKTCQRWDCGRKSHSNVTIGGGVVGKLADATPKSPKEPA